MTWTPEAEQFVRENYARMSASDIAMQLGIWCTKSAVIGKARRLGVEKISKANRWTRLRVARRINASRCKQRATESRPARQKRKPDPSNARQVAASKSAEASITYATFISRSRPGETMRAVEHVAVRAAAKMRRSCAWLPCSCAAEPGQMFCAEHAARAEALRS